MPHMIDNNLYWFLIRSNVMCSVMSKILMSQNPSKKHDVHRLILDTE